MRRVALTEARLAHYRVLCKRQRRKDLVAPPPEHGRTTESTETPGRSPVEQETMPFESMQALIRQRLGR